MVLVRGTIQQRISKVEQHVGVVVESCLTRSSEMVMLAVLLEHMGCSLAPGPGQCWWVQFPELVEMVVEVDEVDIDRRF
jgi:hypothetical protein